MYNLCFLTNLTSSEWAAWIQAVGSVVAIGAAAWIATSQSRAQYKNDILLHQREQLTAQVDLAKTLFVLATNSSTVMQYTASQLNSRDSIHKAAEGFIPSNVGELQRINGYLNAIPLHSIPYSLVTPTMTLGSTVRQFYEKIEMTLRLYREMDASMYEDLFRVLSAMNQSIKLICKDIELEVERLDGALK